MPACPVHLTQEETYMGEDAAGNEVELVRSAPAQMIITEDPATGRVTHRECPVEGCDWEAWT